MNKTFWYATLIRAIRTICQTAIATIGTAMVVTEVDWRYVVSASLMAGILSVLTSLATGLPEVEAVNVLEDALEIDDDFDEFDDEDDWSGDEEEDEEGDE